MLYNMFLFFASNKVIFLITLLNLIILVSSICIFIYAKTAKRKYSKIQDYFGLLTNTVNSVRYGDLSKKLEKVDFPISKKLTDSINRMIETLHDRESMIIEYQSELSRQNRFLEAVINTLSDGIIVVDKDLKILRNTPQISKWFGVEKNKKLIGQKLEDFIKLSNAKSFELWENEEVFVKSSPNLNFSASTMELLLEDKKKRNIIVLKDITNQKDLESLKEDFIATLTHDLKVPIIAETNMLDLFLNENFGPISEKQSIALKNMQASNKELLDLVQIVLETYKYKGTNIRLYRDNIMLKGFIEDIIEEMKPILSKSNNTIKFIHERDIRVFADKIQLKRVLKNLIQNAISYGDSNSPIEITIGEIPKFIIIKVKDYGAGISKEDLKRIFNKYYSAAKKFRKIGTGLGLFLSKQIIETHDGELTVNSELGKYTEFCIKLPVGANNVIF